MKKIKKIKKVDVDEEKGSFFFVALVGLLLVGSIGAVLFFATSRESALNVAPEVNVGVPGDDHWHYAYTINHCGTDLSPSTVTDQPVGIHTHGQGLVHIHPNKPEGAGPNAKFIRFVEAIGAELTDDAYTPGPGEMPTVLSEEEGCDGKPAKLKLAYWADAFDEEAEPTEVLEKNLGDFRFAERGGMVSLALVPEGEDVPRPPIDRILRQAETDQVEYEPSEDLLSTPDSAPPADEADDSTEDSDATDDSAPTDDSAATDDTSDDEETEDSTDPEPTTNDEESTDDSAAE